MENQLQKQYNNYVKKKAPQPALIKNILWAFIVGGIICSIGQFVSNTAISFGFSKDETSAITAIIMVFLGAFLTGLGVYDKIGKRAV